MVRARRRGTRCPDQAGLRRSPVFASSDGKDRPASRPPAGLGSPRSTLVCTAGAWSGEIAALAGLELPVQGEARHLCGSPRRTADCHASLPLTVDFSTGFYFHREGPGLVFRRQGAASSRTSPRRPRVGCPRWPTCRSSRRGGASTRSSPDHNALVGESGQVSRFLYATGFSGHGFQQAPAVGEHVAQLVAGVIPHARPLGLRRRALRPRRRAPRDRRDLAPVAAGGTGAGIRRRRTPPRRRGTRRAAGTPPQTRSGSGSHRRGRAQPRPRRCARGSGRRCPGGAVRMLGVVRLRHEIRDRQDSPLRVPRKGRSTTQA